MSFPRLPFLAAAALVLAVAGCKVETINDFPSKPASVRTISLVPDAASIDVKKDGATVWSGVTLGVPTDYQMFDNRQTSFDIFVPGVTSPITSVSGSLSANQIYSILVYGTVANPQTLLQSDSYQSVNPTNSQLRFAEAAFGAGSIDLFLTTPGLSLDNQSPQFQLGFGSTTPFALTATGNYQLRLLRSNSGFVVYDSGTIALADQATQTFYIYTKDGTHALNVLKVNNAGGTTTAVPNLLAAFKVVNGAYQAGTVDEKTDGVLGIQNIAYPATSETYNTLLAGTRTITFESHAAPGAAIATTTATFAPSTDSTLLISGPNGSEVITVLPDNNISVAAETAKVRFVNGSADVPAFDVAIDGVVKAANVAYTHASDYFNLDNSNHKVQLLVPGTTTAIFTVDQQQFGGGQVTTFYLVGPASALTKIISPDNV